MTAVSHMSGFTSEHAQPNEQHEAQLVDASVLIPVTVLSSLFVF